MKRDITLTKQHEAAIRTIIRAYGIGWAASTVPALASLLVKTLLLKQQQQTKMAAIEKACTVTLPHLLKQSVISNGFAVLVAGALGGHRFLLQQGHHHLKQQSSNKCADNKPTIASALLLKSQKAALFLSAFITFWFVRRFFPKIKTLDLTLFALVRAADVYARRMYASSHIRQVLPEWILEYGCIGVFMLASTEIMYTWFYEPEKLPKSYESWITDMAGIDDSLRKLLQMLKNKEIVYGKDLGTSQLLFDYCDKIGVPRSFGDPRTGRVHCSLVHEGKRWGCEYNALFRFSRGFKKIFPVYLFVHLAPPLFFRTKRLLQNPIGSAFHILSATTRSSTFLGSFIAIMWYCICLTRTRIGYKVLEIPQQTLDTVAPLVGSMLCGLSLLIEGRHRRGEMALYVVPRALFSFMERALPQRMKKGLLAEMTENVVFSASVTVLLNAIYHNTALVRPSIRGLLSWILKYEIQEQQQEQPLVDDDNATVVATINNSRSNSDSDDDIKDVRNSTGIGEDDDVEEGEIQLEILNKKLRKATSMQ